MDIVSLLRICPLLEAAKHTHTPNATGEKKMPRKVCNALPCVEEDRQPDTFTKNQGIRMKEL